MPRLIWLTLTLFILGAGCKKNQHAPNDLQSKKQPKTSQTKASSRPTHGLILAFAQFQSDDNGNVTAKPGAARFDLLWEENGSWEHEIIEDTDSNVFHKAFPFVFPSGDKGIVTLGGSDAIVKFWVRKTKRSYSNTTLWKKDFGGKFNRMRDAEVAQFHGRKGKQIVVGTHDQGVVAILDAQAPNKVSVEEIGQEKNTFIHEIEIGDIDGNDILEIYATPSEPNKLKGGEQHGTVVRYSPTKQKGPVIVADLGNRHAKEIVVSDVDGDGTDELYVAIEALTEQGQNGTRLVESVQIRRYDAGTDPTQGKIIASIPDRLCRFLTVGDVDGDGNKEIIAAAFRSGLWLLKPKAKDTWDLTNFDRESSGFEHAALATDLNSDGKDELYVASDDQSELRRYTWSNGVVEKETIWRHDKPKALMTWNITSFPLDLIK